MSMIRSNNTSRKAKLQSISESSEITSASETEIDLDVATSNNNSLSNSILYHSLLNFTTQHYSRNVSKKAKSNYILSLKIIYTYLSHGLIFQIFILLNKSIFRTVQLARHVLLRLKSKENQRKIIQKIWNIYTQETLP